MPEINYVTAQLSPNQIVEGYYIVDGDVLTMVHNDGEPVVLFERTDLAQKVEHHLSPDESPRAIAAVLTKKIRRIILGEKVEGFLDPINYPRAVVA